MLSRKEFLAAVSGIACASFAPWSLMQLNEKRGVAKPKKELSFDLHAHPRSMATLQDMIDSQLGGVFISLVADLPLLQFTDTGVVPNGKFGAGEGWKEFQRQLATVKDLLKSVDLSLSESRSNPNRAIKKRKPTCFLACEGGDFLEGDIEKLTEAHVAGLRSLQLVHYVPNDLGDLQTSEPQHQGLSPFGREVIKKMNALGIVIDLAHASFATVKAAAEVSSDPLILSHSILKRPPFMPISARALTEEHAKLIAATGGVVGMWPSGLSKDLNDFVDQTFRLVDLIGVDHVGIGTDMDGNYKPVITNYTEFFDWSDKLTSRGMAIAEVEKITGGNAFRVIKEVIVDR
jgi:membrane dipeptidase